MSLFGKILVDEIKYAFRDTHLDISYNEYDFDDDVIWHDGMFNEWGTSSYIGGSYDTWELIIVGGTYYIEYQHATDIVYFYSVKPNVRGFIDRDYIDIGNMGFMDGTENIISTLASIMLDDDAMIFWN